MLWFLSWKFGSFFDYVIISCHDSSNHVDTNVGYLLVVDIDFTGLLTSIWVTNRYLRGRSIWLLSGLLSIVFTRFATFVSSLQEVKFDL